MRAKITIGWEPSLSKNNAYVKGDMKLGHTKQCQKAMWDIVMLMRPAVGYGWKWNVERINVTITVYRPGETADAQNFVDTISDALQEALRVDDRYFDVTPVAEIDRDKPRIEIEVWQNES